jgi:Bacterial protein of unknown function (DUF899)
VVLFSDGQGISVFVRDGNQVFHTYFAYGVGADVMLSTYRFLDLTPAAVSPTLTNGRYTTLTASPAATCTSQACRSRRATGFGLPGDFRPAGGSNQLAA